MRGLSTIDRIALRVVSALLIAGIIGLFAVISRNTTTLAIVQNDLQNLITNTNNDVMRLNGRVNSIESLLNSRTQDRYTYKDALKDQQLFNFRLTDLEERFDTFEDK